jgi:RNA polymerase sigma factor (sigma-70 family)
LPAFPTLTRELLVRYLAGSYEAERRLFERMRPGLLQRARRHRLPPSLEPEDAVQEAFWRVLSSGLLSRFEDRGPGSLEAALVSVLDRTVKDMLRRAGARKRSGELVKVPRGRSGFALGIEPEPTGREVTPTSNARHSELEELCRRTLGEREWEAWRRVELGGWSAVDAAEELGESAASVRGLLFRARQKLVKALGGAGAGA